MVKPDKTGSTMDDGGSNPENSALSSDRIRAFVQEPAREGNILVTLPDQATDVDSSCRDHKKRIKKDIRDFGQKFNH